LIRVLTAIGSHEEDGLGRPFLVFGALLVVLVWFCFSWDAAMAKAMVGQIFTALRDVIGQVAAIFLVSAGAVVTMVLAVLALAALARHGRMAAELRLRRAELDQSRDRLRRYVADLERISEIANHDLQEPLRRMVAYSQLLAQHDQARLDDEVRFYLSHVIDGARRMKDLVGGLQAFVSVDSLPPSAATVSASDAVTVARRRLSTSLGAAGAALVVDPLPEVVADPDSLVEIFVQLIDNAIRFRAADRRPVIHVSAIRRGDEVTFVVHDNGIGIEPGRAARMFEICYRSPVAGSGSGSGIGMGLAVVRRLVERMGGSVAVDSQLGKGSAFSVTLPATTSSRVEATVPGQEAQAA